MASILRIKIRWSGLPGGNGYSMFHFRDFSATEPTVAEVNAAIVRVENMTGAIRSLIPAGVSMTVESEGEVLEETNGQLLNVINGTSAGAKTGTATAGAGFSAPAGAVISWSTGGVRNGRRVRGRTFIVPLSNVAYDVDGSLTAAALTTLNSVATSLRDGSGTPDLGIWARPSATGANDGIWYVVTGHRVPDMSAILRSRRS